jgi:hypothetical protein
MSASNWKVEVIADNSGEWRSNGMLFGYELEARVYAIDLARRRTSVREYRVVEVPVPANEMEGEVA